MEKGKFSCRYLLIWIGLIGISSCSDDIAVFETYSPQRIVYCQVDPTEDYCYVTLSKSFQTKGNTIDALQNTEQSRINDARIKLEAWGEGFLAWETEFHLVEPELTGPISGIYSRSLYRSNEKLEFNDPTIYGGSNWIYQDLRLIITNTDFVEPAYSRIPIIHAPRVIYPVTPMDLNLYGAEQSYFEFAINKDEAKYADFYCDFYFKEYRDSWKDNMVRFIVKKNLSISNGQIIRLYDSFFNKLAMAIENNPEIKYRKILYMDFILFVTDIYFKDYFSVSNNNYSSDYIHYSNIEYGIGLFSVKRKSTVAGINFDDMTYDSLRNHELTRSLNFIK